ncbi:hypothetical protein PIB30_033086 [Stylosanthes scabra]|uniref:Uncharacterized protein n=1 Tax=Stylosanthes scabra TaxID=79078 RepID=A0ABU6RCV0_9FABA|nr:hypothetical protein [Stylosanthes scabra]
MEFLTSLATEAVSKLGTLVVGATVEQFKYIISHKKIVADLKEEHAKLKMMKTALERLVEEDRSRGLEITEDVKGWLEKVQDIDAKLERIYAEEDEANKKKRCSNLASKYSLGKRATKNARNIEGLIKEKEGKYNSIISLPKSPPKYGSLYTQDIKALGSRKEILKKVMEKLKEDKVKRISVCGLGGVGKTTLAKEVIENIETSKLFDKFAFAAVSQDPDYEKIQMEIAEMLHYNFQGKTMQVKAAELYRHVTSEAKSVLIVLDDIWHDLDFELLGLPSLEQQQGCKFLFTSRDKKVCQSMKCDQENIIDVPVLPEPEDWHLFREMAGDVVDKADIKNTAKEIAMECGGLPLALVVVARALANEEDKHAWIDAHKQLRGSPLSSFPDMQKLVYSRIEKSVNFLGSEEHKWCLWLCGLYPEDFDIPVESLLRHGMGMGMFKVNGALCEARNHVHTLILHLKRCFLLLDNGKPGCVKMHDVVRDVVISIASKVENGFLIQYNAKLKSTEERKLDHVKAISLVLDDTKELESDSEYPALQLLQVRSKSKEPNPWPEHFFQGMSKLKVLDDGEHSFANLKDLRIDSCPNLEYIFYGNCASNAYSHIQSLSLKSLPNLREICNVVDHHGNKLMIQFSHLVKLELRYLPSFNGFSKGNDTDEVTQPTHNHELGLVNANTSSEIKSVASHSESSADKFLPITSKLFTCRWLHHHFPKLETILLVSTCQSLEMVFDLQGCSSQLNHLFPQLKNIQISYLSSLIHVWGNAPTCVYGFQNVRSLSISDCNSLRYAFTPAIVKAMTKLENLEVKRCELMESLVGDDEHEEGEDYKVSGEVKIISFEALHSLILWYLPNIASICPSSWELELPSIRKFQIYECPKLRISSLLTSHHQVDEKLHNNVSNASDDTHFEKNHPRRWYFGCTSFCSNLIPYKNTSEKSPKVNDYVPSNSERKLEMSRMPRLEELDISNCELHDKVLLQDGDHQRIRNFPALNGYLFQKLTSLNMVGCNNIIALLSLSPLRTLECLENLEVKYCENVEQIISHEELETSENKLMLPKLQYLILQHLPNLKAFCQSSCLLDFPSLRKLEIDYCPKIEVFSRGSCHTPKLEDVQITGPHGSNHIQNGDLNATIQGFKAFEALHESETPRWNLLCNEHKFSYLTELAIKKFHKMAVLSPSNEIHALHHLRELNVQHCDSLVELFESERGMVAKNAYEITYKLQSLELIDLPKLRHIWLPNIVRLVSFKMLTSIRVIGCGSLKSVLSESMAISLVQLQELDVSRCEMMEEIVTMDDGGNQFKTLLPNLVWLELSDLPKLECVCSRIHHEYDILFCDDDKDDKGICHLNDSSKQQIEVSFPQLNYLSLDQVPRLKCFCPGAYDYDIMVDEDTQITNFPNHNVAVAVTVTTPKLDTVFSSFGSMRIAGERDVNLTIHYLVNRMKYKEELQQLETFRCIIEQHQYQHLLGYITREPKLEVERCHKLLTCVPSNMMHLFQHVKILKVEQCECLQEIFESNDYGVQGTQLELQHIWRNHASISGFEYLKYLRIRECHELTYVFRDVSVARSLPQLYLLEVVKCNKMKEIISPNNNYSIQKKRSKIIFPRLEFIKLEKLSSLSCFCPSYLHFELPGCASITIEECPKMETFCFGTVYTPYAESIKVEGRKFGRKEDVNEAIKEIRATM